MKLKRVVVGIDPATTNTEDSDETGIVACGLGADGHGYVLDDFTLRASPDGWARKAWALFDKHQADRVVVEVNQGGEMVRHTLETVRKNGPITTVHAKKAKRLRAEPIAALYEQGRVHHVGMFRALEDQMTTWDPDDENRDDSPDRIDALVYALTELMLDSVDVDGIGFGSVVQESPWNFGNVVRR